MKNAQIINTKATPLAARSHSSFLRSTMSPEVSAHFSTVSVISALAFWSRSPDLTVFLASNSAPAESTFSFLPTAALTGSTSLHCPRWATPRIRQCLSLTCCRVIRPRSAR